MSFLTATASAALLIVGLAAPSSATTAEVASHEPAADAVPDDIPELGEVFDPGDLRPNYATCLENWCEEQDTGWDDRDGDGRWAWVRLASSFDQSEFYQVYFDPYGERLILWDRFSDGHQARADVVVRDPSGAAIDRDSNLYTSYTGEFNLGTPDGSGDITEGLRVAIRVCLAGTTICSGWATGRS
jgi:catechol 2,3-dioxygenase-like lactoylglutathione lyase family enzyme